MNRQDESFTPWLQEEDDDNLYMSIQQLRDRTIELSNQVSLLERSGSGDVSYQQSLEELRVAQDQLSELVEARNCRYRHGASQREALGSSNWTNLQMIIIG